MTQLEQGLQGIFAKRDLRFMEPMSAHTTLKLGGPAQAFAVARDAYRISRALALCGQLEAPLTVIGNGSNLLVRDGGMRGVALMLGKEFAGINKNGAQIEAGAGASLAALCAYAAEGGLSGLEFASGIPGTVGGALAMNAGAYGGEMKDSVVSCRVMTRGGEEMTLTNAELDFGYRDSRILKEELIALSAVFSLTPRDTDTVRAAMREFMEKRRDKQPMDAPTCGSTFKRPEGGFAGTLIEGCGLKGFRIGGASVSEKHAGFLVNDGEGTAEDYLALMAHVQRVVYEQTGVSLTPEVRILGQDAPITGV